MPRGQYYPEELREAARQLRREGYLLNEISARRLKGNSLDSLFRVRSDFFDVPLRDGCSSAIGNA